MLCLLAVQGGCAFIAQAVYRLQVLAGGEATSREQRYASAVAAGVPAQIAFPAAMGYVDRLVDGGLVVMTAETPAEVRVDRFTVYRGPAGPAGVSDVVPGAGIIVAGGKDADGRILADVVVVGPAP